MNKKKKTEERNQQQPQNAWRYREVLCPLCDHRFMFETSRAWAYSINGEGYYYESKCPKCEEALLVPENELEAILRSDIPEEDLKIVSIRIS